MIAISPQHHFHTKHAVWPMSEAAYKYIDDAHQEHIGAGIGYAYVAPTTELLELLESAKTDIGNNGRTGSALNSVYYFAQTETGRTTCGMIGLNPQRNKIVITR